MKKPTHVANLVIVLDGLLSHPKTSILLGLKYKKMKDDGSRKIKRVGKGFWMPAGGKKEPVDATNKHAVRRELGEEFKISVPLSRFKKVALIRGETELSRWKVDTYLIEITPAEKKMARRDVESFSKISWFPLKAIPYDGMMKTDKHWLPQLLKGKTFVCDVSFDSESSKVESVKITPRKF